MPGRFRICFFFQAEDGIRDVAVTGVRTCALPIWTSAASMPEWMKRQLALAVWAVCCPARTLDRFKFTSASWLLGCWRCFFSTHGWLSHGDYFDSAARRSGGVHVAACLR